MRELPGNAIREARTAPAVPDHARRGVVIATVAALVMTLTGAFDTDMLGVAARLGYWLIIMEAGALIGMGATTAIRGWGGLAAHPWREGAAISLLIAAPLTLVVLGTTIAFFAGSRATPAGIAFLFAMVLAVTAVITAINYATRPAPPVAAHESTAATPVPMPNAAEPEPEPMPAARSLPRLAERLPPHLRYAEVHALEAEDHYLRVHTAAGSALILLRIGDAVAELDGVDGARTHRSWWVARQAVRAVARKSGRAELTLPCGTIAPVSRSAYPQLRDAGWFD